MLKLLYIIFLGFTASSLLSFTTKPINSLAVNTKIEMYAPTTINLTTADILYSKFSFTSLSKDAFSLAYNGYEQLLKNKLVLKNNILTIIDYSKSSTQKRLFILNVATGKLILSSLVAHGKNSGLEFANSFSNENESNKSSLGFYTTANTYEGEHGYSLKLKGCEKGINDAAYQRAIVLHGANYVSTDIINAQGFLGRSLGCPAVPENISKKIIDNIKNGSCLFIYHSKYKSKIIQ